MEVVRRLSDFVFKVEKILSIVFMTVITISLTLGVVFRYILQSSLIGTDEIAIFCLVWTTFLGGSMALKSRLLASATFFLDRLSRHYQRIFILIGLGIVVLFLASLLVISISWILSPTILFQTSSSLQIPMIIPYLSVPVGIGFMSIHALNLFLESLQLEKVKSLNLNLEKDKDRSEIFKTFINE